MILKIISRLFCIAFLFFSHITMRALYLKCLSSESKNSLSLTSYPRDWFFSTITKLESWKQGRGMLTYNSLSWIRIQDILLYRMTQAATPELKKKNLALEFILANTKDIILCLVYPLSFSSFLVINSIASKVSDHISPYRYWNSMKGTLLPSKPITRIISPIL